MADKKISELPSLSGANLADDDKFVVVDTDTAETKAVDFSELKSATTAALIDSAPSTLDTLNELAAALGDDPNFATTVTNSIADKLPLAGGDLTGGLTVAGNVGIGTGSPSAKLDLLNTSAISTPAARFYANRNGGSVSNLLGFQVYNNVSGGFFDTTLVYGNTASSYLALGHHNGTSYTERMRIHNNGNVGIGTGSPSAKLDVNGDAEINGLTVGRGAGDVSTNTAVGNNALLNNTTGSNNTALGKDAEALSATADNQIAIRAGDTKWYSSAGSPEGVVTAGVGSMYTNSTGGSGTTLYVKESGTGNTGWVAK